MDTVAHDVKAGDMTEAKTEEEVWVEPMLRVDPGRFVLTTKRRKNIWDMYKAAEASFWTADEIDLAHDITDWNSLTKEEQHFLKIVLAFFAASDGIVNENLVTNFASEIQWTEARFFYGFQIAIENIHSEVYSKLLQTYVPDEVELDNLFRGIETIPAIKSKAEWAIKWFDAKRSSFAERLFAFAVVEGVFFSSSFCSIFFFKKRGLMPGLTFSNELISRDEGSHCDFACMLYRELKRPLSQERVYEIMADAVQCEKKFVNEALPISLIGMNADLMGQYVEYCADLILKKMGYKPMYDAEQPFDWITLISLEGKTNFFEKRVAEYAKMGAGDATDNAFSLVADY